MVKKREALSKTVPQLAGKAEIEEFQRRLEQIIDERSQEIFNEEAAPPLGVPGFLADEIRNAQREMKDKLKRELTMLAGKAQLSRTAAAEESIVFVSCGQYSEEEISLGKAVERLVEETTGVTAYFAENQNSLQALSENIFHSLRRAAGFIAIMHHRGTVKTPHGTHIRGSVWIEQEIAIAAFLTASGQSFPVIVYQQTDEDGVSIKREGVREQLRLDPVAFHNADDVLRDLNLRIETGKFAPQKSNGQTRSAREEATLQQSKGCT